MSDQHSRVDEAAPPLQAQAASNNHEESYDPIAHFSSHMLERSDSLIYAIVGVFFLLGSLFALGYSIWDFLASILIPKLDPSLVAQAIIKLVSDLLLVLIIMEVMGTVIHYLKAHATSLRPFLFIGIVSATRGILSIGARLSVENVKLEDFNRDMIELAVNGAVILALGITLKLLGRLVED
ncbi:MAG TPA: phosphate-starvation-inducible PsiE family protein [Ktedonobacteraceae bacterium]|jgi:uncharacterized membrane protein (DUF373 family)|nr:phosphate-starvation-inducible PsiE family protein [Ktedonobacteraceae bacterium]